MSIFFSFLALAACLSLAACNESEREQYENERDKRLERIASLIEENLGHEVTIDLLKANLDSLDKVGERLQKNNRALYQEVKEKEREVKEKEREVRVLDQKVKKKEQEVQELKAEKRANEEKIAKMSAELAEISVDRDRLTGHTKNLQEKLVFAQQALRELREVQNSVRLMVGTEKLLEGEGFLKIKTSVRGGHRPGSSGRRHQSYQSYQLVKPLSDDPSVKLVLIDQELPLNIQTIPKALVGRSGKLKLKALVGHSGKLKEGRDYKVNEGGGTTIITFTNRDLVGADVMAVVEVKN